jgi:adenosine kinase
LDQQNVYIEIWHVNSSQQSYTAQFLQEPEIWQLLEKARIFYIGGFIIPVSSDAVLRVAKYAAENNKIVVMNLHARFLCKHFADPKLNLMQIAPHLPVDISL